MRNYYIYIRIIFNVLDKLAFVLHLHSHDASVAVFFATVFHWCSYWFNGAFRTQSQLASGPTLFVAPRIKLIVKIELSH